jgi:hypothetical protein
LSTDLATPDVRDISFGDCHLTATGIRFDTPVSFEVWSAAAAFVQRTCEASPWWQADLLLAAREDERYEQAVSLLARDYTTLRNYVWVAQCYPLAVRRAELTFTHHVVAAALDEPARSELLAAAVAQGWSVSRLKRQVREYNRNGQRLPEPVLPSGKYRCIVLAPPWPTDATSGVPVVDLRPKLIEQVGAVAADDACHLYLMAPQRQLSVAMELVEALGFRYSHLLTRATPCDRSGFGWASDVELVVFAIRGRLEVIALGQKTTFNTADDFYDRVRAASPGPRLSMYDSKEREGFETWGPGPSTEAACELRETLAPLGVINPPEVSEPESPDELQQAGGDVPEVAIEAEPLEQLSSMDGELDALRERLTAAGDVQGNGAAAVPIELRDLCAIEESARAIEAKASGIAGEAARQAERIKAALAGVVEHDAMAGASVATG